MIHWIKYRWSIALGAGFVAGLLLSGLWPQTPLHGVATDRTDTFAIATGPVDNDTEAVYFLDFLTGDLRAVVIGQKPGTFTGFFSYNVNADLGVDPAKAAPKYLMVTGIDHLRREGGTRMQPSSSLCYVAEVTSGKVAAYAIPWSPSMHAANQPNVQLLAPVAVTSFRPPTVSGSGPGAAPARGSRKLEKD
jgi:hypothetical protein